MWNYREQNHGMEELSNKASQGLSCVLRVSPTTQSKLDPSIKLRWTEIKFEKNKDNISSFPATLNIFSYLKSRDGDFVILEYKYNILKKMTEIDMRCLQMVL